MQLDATCGNILTARFGGIFYRRRAGIILQFSLSLELPLVWYAKFCTQRYITLKRLKRFAVQRQSMM
jgi:hypothetical protein